MQNKKEKKNAFILVQFNGKNMYMMNSSSSSKIF